MDLETLSRKQAALNRAREERGNLEDDLPELNEAVRVAKFQLNQAQIDAFEKGPDGAGEVEAAQAALDEAVKARAAAEDRLQVVMRAQEQFGQEVKAALEAHQRGALPCAKEAVKERLAAAAPVVRDAVRDLYILAELNDGRRIDLEFLYQELGDRLGFNTKALSAEGINRARAFKAGGDLP